MNRRTKFVLVTGGVVSSIGKGLGSASIGALMEARGLRVVGRVLGDPRGREMVEDLLRRQKAAARELLAEHRHLVAALRDALLERRELVGSKITDVLTAARDEHGSASPVVDLTAVPPRVR